MTLASSTITKAVGRETPKTTNIHKINKMAKTLALFVNGRTVKGKAKVQSGDLKGYWTDRPHKMNETSSLCCCLPFLDFYCNTG